MRIEELYEVFLKYPSVQTDTRKLRKNDLFFALKGPSFNGNQFAQQAIDKGSAHAIIDDPSYAIEGKTFLVDDVLGTLQQLALHHRRQFDIPFIAITGSNGKTTTKELIHAALSSRYITYTTEGNLNNHIGVPLTILKIRKDAQMAVIEMGANHLKEIASYCTIALPTHGLITNCGKAHLEGFGSEEGVRKGKGELFDYLRANNGTAFVMKDYPYLQEMSHGISKVISYGTHDADVSGEAGITGRYLSVNFQKGFSGGIQTKLVGDYNLPNVLAAVAVSHHFSVPDDLIRQSLENYMPTNSRSQFMEKNSNKIILDAYNANPNSMKAAIKNFAESAGENKILVLGAMAELGNDSIAEHEEIIEEIKKYPWTDVLLVGGDFLNTSHSFHRFNSSADAGAWLQREQKQNSFLLVKGSRSMQMEKVLDYI